jgi:uncharacterized membrane protein
MKPKLISLWPIFILVAAVIVGISLRISDIETRDYWYDEAFTGVTVRQPFAEMMRIVIADVHPPLYYWLLKGWSLVAGTSPIALRLFSVTFGVAMIVLAFFAMHQWYKRSWIPACAAAVVVAINPFFTNYSQEARMYTMLAVLLLAAAMLLTKSWETRSSYDRFAYGAFVLAILLTHYIGFVFVMGFVLADLWHLWTVHPSRRAFKAFLRESAYAYAVPFVGGLLWLPVFLRQAQNKPSLGWVPDAVLSHLPLSLHIFLFGAPVGVHGVPPALGYRVEWLTPSTVALLLTIMLTTLIVYLAVKQRFDRNLSFLAFMTFFPLALTWALQAAALQLYVERFLSGSALFLSLFLVLALAHLSKRDYLVALTGIYAFLVILIQPWDHKSSFPELTQTAQQFIDKTPIIFSSPFDFTVARFYLGEQDRHATRIYNVDAPNEDLSNWAIVEASDQISTLPTTSHIVITPDAHRFTGYQTIAEVNQFRVLKK